METNLAKVYEKKIERVVKTLGKNNYDARYFTSREDLYKALDEMMPEGAVTAKGGSQTLEQSGVFDFIKQDKYNYLDPKKPGLSKEEVAEIRKEIMFSDYFFTSSNAVTETGGLYNVDAFGTRVAPLIYGPKNVVVVVTGNKIVKDLDMAIQRNREIAAPANCTRLDMPTPCVKTGKCMDCKTPDRACILYTYME